MIQRLGVWTGGGMGPRTVDRAELRARLSAEAPGWVVDELADAFEPAFLAFQRKAAEAEKKRRGRGSGRDRRPRQGRGRDEPRRAAAEESDA